MGQTQYSIDVAIIANPTTQTGNRAAVLRRVAAPATADARVPGGRGTPEMMTEREEEEEEESDDDDDDEGMGQREREEILL